MVTHDVLEAKEVTEVELVEVAEFDQRVGVLARRHRLSREHGRVLLRHAAQDATTFRQDTFGSEPEEENDEQPNRHPLERRHERRIGDGRQEAGDLFEAEGNKNGAEYRALVVTRAAE